MKYMVDDIIALEILRYYYKFFENSPSGRSRCEELTEIFGITHDELFGHLFYLSEKRLIDCQFLNGDDAMCRITHLGIDVIRNPEQHSQEASFVNLINVVGNGNTFGPILQAQEIKIEKSFNRVYKAIEDSDLDLKLKKEIYDNVRDIKIEWKKENPKLGRIKTVLDNINKKAPSIYPILTPIIIECIKKYFGL